MRLALMASKALGLGVAESLNTHFADNFCGLLCPDDSQDPRSVRPRFEQLASESGIPFAVEQRTEQVCSQLTDWEAEIVLVAGWYRRIPVERLPDMSFFGFHASPLPRYRGGAPLPWQIIAGEPELGLSFFELTEGLDEGRIVAQSMRPFGSEETIADALTWAGAESVTLLERHLPGLLDGSAELTPQDDSQATYCSQRVPGDGRVDWTASATRVHDLARAQSPPYPGAFSLLSDGRRVTLLRTRVDPRPWLGVPGAVVERRDGVAVLTCGEGAIELHEARIDDGAPMPGDQALDSLAIRLG